MLIHELIDAAKQATGLSQNALATEIGLEGHTLSECRNLKRPLKRESAERLALLAGRSNPRAVAEQVKAEWKLHQKTHQVENLQAQLGKLKAAALGALAMLCIFGASDRALAAAGTGKPMRDDV